MIEHEPSATSRTLEADAAARADADQPVRGRIAYRLGAYGALLGMGYAMWQDVPSEAVGGLAVAMMFVLLLMKVPIGVAMAVAGLLGLGALRGSRLVISTLADMPYDIVASWSLSVLPMFVFMGLLLWRSGLTTKLYDAGRDWLGWLPGSLAVATNFAGAGLAAASGSSFATTYALARIGIPEMLRAGYDKRLAVGSVLMAGTGGQMIPPSIFLVIYAGVAQVAVGPQLLAGVIPGVLLALAYGLMLIGIGIFKPAWVGGRDARVRMSMAERVPSLLGLWPLPMLILIVMGGLLSGVFTATEAGAAGALGALLLMVWSTRRDQPLRKLSQAVVGTVGTIGAIFFLFIGAYILGRLVSISGIATGVARLVVDYELTRMQFLLIMLVVYLVLGMFMDPLTMMLLTVPILLPVLGALEISLLWFGVFVVFLGELSVITPPVGILAFILHGITRDPEVNLGQDIRLSDVFKGVALLMPVSVVVAIILIAFPELVEWLPRMMD